MDVTSRERFAVRGIDSDVTVLAPKEKPKKEPPKAVPYRGPAELVAEIDRAAEQLGLSRNEAMTQLLKYALDAYKAEQAKKPKAKK